MEKKNNEELISKLEKHTQSDASKESQLKDLNSRKNELIAYARDVIKSIQREVSAVSYTHLTMPTKA